MDNRLAMEIEKVYESRGAQERYDYRRRRDQAQAYAESDEKHQVERHEEVRKHNLEIKEEYRRGEEGIDYVRDAWRNDPRIANEQKMKADFRNQIERMRLENPEAAKQYADFFLKRNEIDDLLDGKFDNDVDIESVVRLYPGSPKGPLPSDDPTFYSEWFMRNQPEELIYGEGVTPNYQDIGVRYRYLWNKQALEEDRVNVEDKDDVANYLEQNELFPMQNYDGIPEFDVLDREKYD